MIGKMTFKTALMTLGTLLLIMSAQGAHAAHQLATTASDADPTVQPAKLVGATEYQIQAATNGRSYRIQVSAVGKPPKDGYPVLYVLDGDGMFALASLAAQGMMMRQAENNAVPLLVVGVGYSDQALIDLAARAEDYTPPSPGYANTGDRLSKSFGGAERFYQFLSTQLPQSLQVQGYAINQKQQSILGHSYGGLFALYALLNHPQHFNNYLIASPSIWWNQERVLADLPSLPTKLDTLPVHQRLGVRLTVGEYEQKLAPFLPHHAERQGILHARGMVSNVQKLGTQLQALDRLQVETVVYAGETHASVVMPAINDGLKWLYARCRQEQGCHAQE